MSFDRPETRSGRYREHLSLDGLRSFCGLAIDGTARMPAGSVRCLRCSRAASSVRLAPRPAPPRLAIPAGELVSFLAEALAEADDDECARRVAALADTSEDTLARELGLLLPIARTLTARRLLALAVQVLYRRRTVRELQTLRQELNYGQ
jgi:hypothetical protein